MEFPKLHHREAIVRKAKLELMELLFKLRNDLTPGEYLKVVTEELSNEWHGVAKYMIREERHPDNPDQPGGLE